MGVAHRENMKTIQKIAALLLVALLVLTGYELFHTSRTATQDENGKHGAQNAGQAALVDESALRTAQKLALLADKPEEQEFAAEAIRLADHELDLAFGHAQREAKTHPP